MGSVSGFSTDLGLPVSGRISTVYLAAGGPSGCGPRVTSALSLGVACSLNMEQPTRLDKIAEIASTLSRRNSGRIITVSLHASDAIAAKFSQSLRAARCSLPYRYGRDYR